MGRASRGGNSGLDTYLYSTRAGAGPLAKATVMGGGYGYCVCKGEWVRGQGAVRVRIPYLTDTQQLYHLLRSQLLDARAVGHILLVYVQCMLASPLVSPARPWPAAGSHTASMSVGRVRVLLSGWTREPYLKYRLRDQYSTPCAMYVCTTAASLQSPAPPLHLR